jgi:hypothetical protein
LLLLALLGGCSSETDGLERATLEVTAFDSVTARSGVVTCEELPLLQGSRRYTRHIVDDALVIAVTAEPGLVTLHFENDDGAPLEKPVSVSRGRLLQGYEKLVVLPPFSGGSFELNLQSGCTP